MLEIQNNNNNNKPPQTKQKTTHKKPNMNMKARLPDCRLMRIIDRDRLGANARAEQAYCLGTVIEDADWSDGKGPQAHLVLPLPWRSSVPKQILGFLLSLLTNTLGAAPLSSPASISVKIVLILEIILLVTKSWI